MFNPIPSLEANPLAPVDVAHPPLAMCVAVLIETAGKGSASTLLADGAICKIWGVAGHQPNPPLINSSSSSYGLPPASVAATHHMRMMGGVALSKTAGHTRLGGGCVGVVWGGFLCGRAGGGTTTQKPTWYVCFWLLADHPLASSDAPHCWLATVGADGPESADDARIRDILRGGGRVVW